MILVDKSIKERSGEIFCEGYAEKYVNAISYDLHIKGVICDDALKDSYTLHPGEFIFVQTREMIHMPKDLIGRIGEKNSRIRQGLSVAGPHYYPGHKTYIYLRIQNITCANKSQFRKKHMMNRKMHHLMMNISIADWQITGTNMRLELKN